MIHFDNELEELLEEEEEDEDELDELLLELDELLLLRLELDELDVLDATDELLEPPTAEDELELELLELESACEPEQAARIAVIVNTDKVFNWIFMFG